MPWESCQDGVRLPRSIADKNDVRKSVGLLISVGTQSEREESTGDVDGKDEVNVGMSDRNALVSANRARSIIDGVAKSFELASGVD